MMKRICCILLVITLMCGLFGFGWAEDAVMPAIDTVFYTHDGRVTFVDGSLTDEPIRSLDDAGRVVAEALDTLGGDEKTTLEPWRQLKDAYGNQYFVFRQMYNDTTVLGGAVKVITDAQGGMIGLTSSIVSDLPEEAGTENISADKAEALTLEHSARMGHQDVTVLSELTDRMILPITLNVDMDAGEDEEKSRYVWVVYTNNPENSIYRSGDLPYLAHYITLTGEYLYSLPTLMPGDEAGASGFDASYVFEFMDPVEYEGYVDLSTGGEREIAVTVMRDRRTGMYYLGNLERRIVVADCWEFLYNHGRVVLEYSPDNLEWDQTGLLTLYNYCQAYDFYKAIGWSGGDGMDTPILVLNNYCDQNRKPVDNAAYVGNYLGWQIFLASQANDFAQCLDVLAHEYTHCVTSSVMTYNAYMNDFGAINEAMSDIQGKTCQMLMEGAEDATWEIADKSRESIRSLSEPHRFQQPEFTWDLYYMPTVKTPTVLNDEGGVHTNSSLLNYLAWRLYEKGDMTLEEGRAFWFTVDCAMTPGTDYAQLAELLPWALRVTGLTGYETELRRGLDATRLGSDALPESFDDDRALLSLELPENEVFADEQWIMYVLSVDVDQLIEIAKGMIDQALEGDWSFLSVHPEEVSALRDLFLQWFKEHFRGALYGGTTNAGQDGRHMRMMGKPGYAVPVLLHGVFNEDTSSLEEAYVLVYLGGRWIDLGTIFSEEESSDGEAPTALEKEMEALFDGMIEKLEEISSPREILSSIMYPVKGGVQNVIPSEGLDQVHPGEMKMLNDIMEEETEEAPRRMSRPK